MSDKTSMSLEEIIKSNKSQENRGRGRGRHDRGGNRGAHFSRPEGRVQRARGRGGITRYVTPFKLINAQTYSQSASLVIYNLHYGVTDGDVSELFSEFGPLTEASVHYDERGRSLGKAVVGFERRGDAIKAMKQYHGVPLDGRAMNIELATSKVPSFSFYKHKIGGNRKVVTQKASQKNNYKNARVQKKKPTLEELDKELDAIAEQNKMEAQTNE